MKFLAVHPSPLMYTKIYLRLEPLGLEMVGQAARQAGHDVRLIDLQVETWKDYLTLMNTWKPDAVAFSCNYLANVPEIVDLAKLTKKELSNVFVFVGGGIARPSWRESFWNTGMARLIAFSRAKGRFLSPPCCWPWSMTARRSRKSRG